MKDVRMLKLTTTSDDESKAIMLIEDYSDDRLPKITIYERYFGAQSKAAIYLNREQWEAIAEVAQRVLMGTGDGQDGTQYSADLS